MPPPPSPEFGHYAKLRPEQKRWVDEYLIDLNATAAAVRAGYRDPHASGNDQLNLPRVQAAIRERRELLGGRRAADGAAWVLGKLWDVASADARDIIEVRRVPCRYCWGLNGQYQFTKTESDRLLKAHACGQNGTPFDTLWPAGKPEQAYYNAGQAGLLFDSQGGDGYTTGRDPNPGCSECAGIGHTLHYLADTRKLNPQARQLYRGVKIGRHGIEVLMADQDLARSMLAKHYGVATERRDVFIRTVDPSTLSDEELSRAIGELEAITLNGVEYRTIDNDPKLEATHAEAVRERRRAALAKVRADRKLKGHWRNGYQEPLARPHTPPIKRPRG